MTPEIARIAMGLFAAGSALSLVAGFVLFFVDRDSGPVPAFYFKGSPVSRDAALGFAGMCGCFGCTVALLSIVLGGAP